MFTIILRQVAQQSYISENVQEPISFVQEGSCQQWLVLEAELVMRDSEVVGTKNPTGHSLLVDCRFELPFGEFLLSISALLVVLFIQHTSLPPIPANDLSLSTPTFPIERILKIKHSLFLYMIFLHSTGMHSIFISLSLSCCE
jgi:hypothetical protein